MLARKTKTFWLSISDASQLHKPQHKANLGQALGQKEFAPLLNQKNDIPVQPKSPLESHWVSTQAAEHKILTSLLQIQYNSHAQRIC